MNCVVEKAENVQHIPVLDGIRGIAILLVMIFHFFFFPINSLGQIQISAFWDVIKNIIFSGWIGVDLFFILSGFLITGILLDTKQNKHYLFNFYTRRIFRIFPLYYLFLVVWPILKNLYPPAIINNADPSSILCLWTYTQNILIPLKGWESVPGPLSHFWSLAIEEQFYLVWPFMILLLSRRQAILLCLVILIASPLLRWYLVSEAHVWAAYLLTPTRFDSLAAGGLLALLYRELIDFKKYIRILGTLSFMSLVWLFCERQGLRGEDPPVTIFGLSFLALFFSWFVIEGVLMKSHQMAYRMFTHSALRWFGKYSYCLYVVHQPVILWCMASGIILKLMAFLHVESTASYLALLFVMSMSISMITARISWLFWESMFMRYRNSLMR